MQNEPTQDKVERIVNAVLVDEFHQAAAAFADEMLINQHSLEVVSLRHLMRLRERFINARAMMVVGDK
jgi:hypothetical protein